MHRNSGMAPMKLILHPPSSLVPFSEELDLVIEVKSSGVPVVYAREDTPHPDRHLLLGIIQRVAVAVEEKDAEMVELREHLQAFLRTATETRTLEPGVIIVKTEQGSLATIAKGGTEIARGLVRGAVRYFTSAIRLDVP